MHGKIQRILSEKVLNDLKFFPATALIGPRQCGKSFLAKEIIETIPTAIYLDLEYPLHRIKLSDPLLFLETQAKNLVCIDEIQNQPELFPILRALIDGDRRPGKYLLLGSASRGLINRSSESLAGRISFQELTPFLSQEILPHDPSSMLRHLWRGGYPESWFAPSDDESFRWRSAYLRSYIERDLPLLGLKAPTILTERLLTMCAYLQGQTLNSSKLSESLGVSGVSVRNYLGFLRDALLIRFLEPFGSTEKKRIVKSPKLYFRDTGLAQALLFIKNEPEMIGHPGFGSMWEAYCVENICSYFPDARPSFYRSGHGAEIDLILDRGSTRIAIECKASTAPILSRGFYSARDDVRPAMSIVVCPIQGSFPLKEGVTAAGILEAISIIARA
jgi:predicted AAA+ superfamily ATPase